MTIMEKKWILALLFIVIIGLDFYSKSVAGMYTGSYLFNLLRIEPHQNFGFFMGSLSGLPSIFIVLTQTLLSLFLIPLYFFLIGVLPSKEVVVPFGMTCILGGVLGNSLDKMLYGYAIDILSLNLRLMETPYFNLADISIFMGMATVLFRLLITKNSIWFEGSRRKGRMINPSFQWKRIGITWSFLILFSCLFLFFSYFFIKFLVLELNFGNEENALFYYWSFSKIVLLITGNICLLTYFVEKTYSHRIAGPIYAFERFVEQLRDGNKSPLELRERDYFKELEEISVKVLEAVTSCDKRE